jgi:glycosyltransferase involved in cell wall biosynthesis
MDLITLSIPVYNEEKYIERALLSALNQTYNNIEYLILNDKGTDNSMDIVRQIISSHPRGRNVRIIEHSENLGPGAARNTCIDQAQGEYVFFLDSDDEITSDCISKLYKEMLETNVDMVRGICNEVTGVQKPLYHDKTYRILKGTEQIVLSYFDRDFFVVVWNTLYKTSFLREHDIHCIHHLILEDNYFIFKALLHAQAYSVIPDITYFHHIRSDSITGGGVYNEKVFMQLPLIFSDILNLVQKSDMHPTLKIKVKERLFKRRWGLSLLAMKSLYKVQHYIKEYLNPKYLKDRDVFRSRMLFFAYIISITPFWIKKAGLLIYLKLTNKNK